MSETNRKQSITDHQIVERRKQAGLPVGGTPNIKNYEYRGTPATDVSDDVNAPVEPRTTLKAPRNLTVKSQTIRFAPDGTQYVTVVVEFDEVPGAEFYESRIAKA